MKYTWFSGIRTRFRLQYGQTQEEWKKKKLGIEKGGGGL